MTYDDDDGDLAPTYDPSTDPAFGWTPGQEIAVRNIVEWWAGDREEVFRLHGYAGTGKTHLIRHLSEILGLPKSRIRYVAPSGKAALVLKEKDRTLDASTIHRLIYYPVKVEVKYTRGPRKDEVRTDDKGNPITTIGFVLKTPEELRRVNKQRAEEGKKLHDDVWAYSLIVVDEASMVGSRLVNDLRTFGIPILASGDPFQLPPPGKVKSPDGRRMIEDRAAWAEAGKHDAILTDITRQAAKSPIIRMAQAIRTGTPVFIGHKGHDADTGEVKVMVGVCPIATSHTNEKDAEKFETAMGVAWRADQVIVHTNAQKIAWNERLRRRDVAEKNRALEEEGKPPIHEYKIIPVRGDVLVRLKNRYYNPDYPDVPSAMNGEMFRVNDVISAGEEIRDEWTGTIIRLDKIDNYKTDRFQMYLKLIKIGNDGAPQKFAKEFIEPIPGDVFEWEWHTDKDEKWRNEKNQWGFGRAITVHKAQGSAWKTVCVYGEQAMVLSRIEANRRWLYTAVTRSEERVAVIVLPRS